MLLVVVLGLSAAFLLALSASLQQAAAHRVVSAVTGPSAFPLLRVFHRLVRSPVWLWGQLTNVGGVVVQGAALHLGSLAVVQPLISTQLLFALPLGARRLRLRDWLSAAAIVGAIVLFLVVRGTAPLSGRSDRFRIVIAGVCTLVLAVLLVLVAVNQRTRVYATLLAVAGGLCSAMSAVLIKLTAEDLVSRGVARTAVDWPGYALALCTLCALFLGQQAFASGSLAAAVAAGSTTNPVASYVMGLLVFHAPAPRGAGPLAALGGSGLLLLAGIWGLAHSPAVQQGEPGDGGGPGGVGLGDTVGPGGGAGRSDAVGWDGAAELADTAGLGGAAGPGGELGRGGTAGMGGTAGAGGAAFAVAVGWLLLIAPPALIRMEPQGASPPGKSAARWKAHCVAS
jgi:cytochrome c-type biogenesis protein CcmE